MVGNYIVEDEYTVNIKLRRYVSDKDSLSLKRVSTDLDSEEVADDVTQQPLFTLGCSQPIPKVTKNGFLNNTNQPTPTFTLVPPKGSQITSVSASHLVNGIPEEVNFFINRKSEDGSNLQAISCGADAQEAKDMTVALPSFVSKDGGNVPNHFHKGKSTQKSIEAPIRYGKKNQGNSKLALPSVNVFSEENDLVAKNTFSPPSSFETNISRSHQIESSPKPTSSGSLYVSPIEKHRPRASGELFISKVDPIRVKKSPMDEVPIPGNSRRNRSLNDRNIDQRFEPKNPTIHKTLSCPVTSRLPYVGSPMTSSQLSKNAQTTNNSFRSQTVSKNAARALLTGVLNDQISSNKQAYQYSKDKFPNHSKARKRNSPQPELVKMDIIYTEPNSKYKDYTGGSLLRSMKAPFDSKKRWNTPSSKSPFISPATSVQIKENNSSKAPETALSDSRLSCFSKKHLEELKKREAEEIPSSFNHERCNVCQQLLSGEEKEEYKNGGRTIHSYKHNAQNTLLGDRVVEAYSSVSSPEIPLGGRDNLDGTYREASRLSTVPIDPSHLTSLDLEEKNEAMLVTSDIEQMPPIDFRFQNHLNNNNNNNLSKSCQTLNGSGSKYLVDKAESPIIGHENLAFDASGIYNNQDSDGLFNLGSESCFCDPGYGSDRSEESDENESVDKDDEDQSKYGFDCRPDFLNLKEAFALNIPQGGATLDHVMSVCPFINQASIFDVTVIKNLRGLGLAVTGGIECQTDWPGLIRIKKIYPQTPAHLCGQLQVDDFLLQANDKSLTGLTSHEALEVLRTAGTEVHLVVSRSPEGGIDMGLVSPPIFGSLTAPQPVPSHHLSPSPSFSTCGEFEIRLTKVAGSLGFTLRKQDNSILGHTIRSLVKEPAISDGRIRAGDKLLSVNGTDMCSLSHEEAVRFLRKCPETVVIRLYRDAMQTPVSPASPVDPDFFSKPKQLRKEARDLLSDIAFRKQSPSLSGSTMGDRPGTPRRKRLQKTPSPDIKAVAADRWESLVKEAEEDPLSKRLSEGSYSSSTKQPGESHSMSGNRLNDTYSISSSYRNGARNSRNSSNSSSITPTPESRPQRPTFLDLNSFNGSTRKSQFTPPHEEGSGFPSPYQTSSNESLRLSESKEINSAPLSSTQSDNFSHLQPGYHSVNLGTLPSQAKQRLTNTSSDHDLNSHLNGEYSMDHNSTLLKWKGVMFTPDNDEDEVDEDSSSTPLPYSSLGNDFSYAPTSDAKPKVLTIEMTRGWNSRLGFSLQSQDGKTAIVAIYADSVAARDGRLKVGDQILEVNNDDVRQWHTEEVIDLLRKIRGKIILKVLQQ